MGFARLVKLDNAQIQRLIRSAAADSANVYLTAHAKKRMRERHVTMACVLDCLRNGEIQRPPVEHAVKGSLECRMERYFAGTHVAAVVALQDEDPGVIVVTVFFSD
jgi:hypothetical protein